MSPFPYVQAHHRLRPALLVAALLLLSGAGALSPPLRSTGRADAASVSRHTTAGPQRYASASVSRTTVSVLLYLIAIGDEGKSGRRIGCGDSLVAVRRPIPPTTAPLTAAMRLLLSNHHRFYGQSGLYNPLYHSRLRVQRATVVNGRATVHLVGTMSLGGECDNPRVGAQLRQTTLQFSTVHSVAIFINNVPLWKRLSLKGR